MRTDVLVLITAYNPSVDSLKDTIESITNQTYPADICVVDDGSAQPISDIIKSVSNIKCITLPKNMGVNAAARVGIQYGIDSGYKYIARMDVGDTNEPTRINVQRDFMEKNPNVSLVGARSKVVSPSGQYVGDFGIDGQNEKILKYLWLNSAFRHSTFFFRTNELKRLGNYDPSFILALDYEILLRFALHGEVAGLSSVLINDIENPNGLTIKKRRKQIIMRMRGQWKHRRIMEPRWWLGILRAMASITLPYSFIRYMIQMRHIYSERINKA